MSVTGIPTFVDSGGGEIGVLGVIFIIKARDQQANDVHARRATGVRQGTNGVGVAKFFWDMLDELPDYVTKTMDLRLPRNLACDPT